MAHKPIKLTANELSLLIDALDTEITRLVKLGHSPEGLEALKSKLDAELAKRWGR